MESPETCVLLRWLERTFVEYLFKAHNSVYEHMLRCRPDKDVVRSCVLLPLPHKHITSAAALLLHRLHAFTKETLHLIGRAGSPYCNVSGNLEDVGPILLTCSQYDTESKIIPDFVRGDAERPQTFMDCFFELPTWISSLFFGGGYGVPCRDRC